MPAGFEVTVPVPVDEPVTVKVISVSPSSPSGSVELSPQPAAINRKIVRIGPQCRLIVILVPSVKVSGLMLKCGRCPSAIVCWSSCGTAWLGRERGGGRGRSSQGTQRTLIKINVSILVLRSSSGGTRPASTIVIVFPRTRPLPWEESLKYPLMRKDLFLPRDVDAPAKQGAPVTLNG